MERRTPIELVVNQSQAHILKKSRFNSRDV